MRTISLSLLSIFTACAADPATNETEYLFGLTADQLLEVKHVATAPMSDAEWLDAHRGDFDCAHYGDLCQLVGRAAAFDVIELGYTLALQGADGDAIRVAQNDAIGAAQIAWKSSPDKIVPYASTTNFAYGGSANKRIKFEAHATKLWPSLELRASGECTYQKNQFGWLPSNNAVITVRLTATFSTAANTVVETSTITQAGFATVYATGSGPGGAPTHMTADALTTSVFCSATDGLWTASGTTEASI
jgi:hypothetical protein